MLVEDAVTTGGSTVKAIQALADEGRMICGVLSICDRLAGGADAIREAAGGAPYLALTTIDEVYPERPDR
jgi:orotate phosphoribosyltransferase